ncbi:DUF6712 family protein [Hymenobacter sp. BT491]|uniref:DUF6712 family protein n=1 Tax=Hymenobacter sp. BT491 TaxID=2766779 RepID=UPI001653A659|nr:DUF6712 family protein [Hymenobacter sp. BT491]MBC6988568.1 hypothetical protein [Hymenobacter sp. BT491]
MALIQNIEQFIAHVTFNSQADEDTYKAVLPDLLLMEDEHIRPLLGDAFYQELVEQIEEGIATLNEPANRLLQLLHSALANLTMLSYLDMAQVQISGSGVQIISDSTQKTAFQWQINDLKVSFSRKGFNGLEKALAFLQAHETEFATWASSEAARKHRELFLSSASQFTEYYSINNAGLTYRALVSLVRKTEAFALEPAIGTDFFDELKEQLVDETLTPENKALVAKYLQPALAHLTMAQAIGELGFSLNGNALELNVYRPDNSNAKESDPGLQKLLELKQEQALDDGERYLRRLRKHLNETASATRYATYFGSSAYQTPLSEESYLNDSTAPVYGAF